MTAINPQRMLESALSNEIQTRQVSKPTTSVFRLVPIQVVYCTKRIVPSSLCKKVRIRIGSAIINNSNGIYPLDPPKQIQVIHQPIPLLPAFYELATKLLNEGSTKTADEIIKKILLIERSAPNQVDALVKFSIKHQKTFARMKRILMKRENFTSEGFLLYQLEPIYNKALKFTQSLS